MNTSELTRLGRWLVDVARDAAAEGHDPPMTPGQSAVLADIQAHGRAAVGEIASRTGFVQGYVSAVVAQLRQRGLLSLTADPDDRRRTLVAPEPAVAVLMRHARPADEALARAAPTGADVEKIVETVEHLVRLVLREGDAPLAPSSHPERVPADAVPPVGPDATGPGPGHPETAPEWDVDPAESGWQA